MTLLAAFRRPGILLALPMLLALAARVLVAPGWMIESDGGGSITVHICSDPANPNATMTIPIDRPGDQDGGLVQQHCPWGALAVAPVTPAALVIVIAPALVEPPHYPAPMLGFAPGIASPLPPSTGPPAFA